jgi:hypothetical protein
MSRTYCVGYCYQATTGEGSTDWERLLRTVGCSAVVKALCYKPKGYKADELNVFFNLPNPSGRSRPWGSLSLKRNEHQKQKNNVTESKVLPVRTAENLTVICEPVV